MITAFFSTDYNRVFLLLALLATLFFSSCNSCSKEIGETDVQGADFPELTEALKNDPKNADLYQQRAIKYLEIQKVQEALNDINRALGINSNKAAYYITRSDIYFAGGKATPARTDLFTALEKDASNTEAMLKIAELHLYFKEYDQCVSYINKALDVNPDYAQAHFMLGFVHMETGDTTRAIRQFQITTEKDRRHYHAFLQLGLLHAAKHSPLAIDYYRNALDINPVSTEAMYNLGMYYQEHKFFNEAIETYTSIVKIDPKFKFAYFNLGYIHLEMLQVNNVAAEYFTKAIQADPFYAEAWYNRGVALENMGDVVNARRDYQKALEFKHNYELAIDGLNRLDQME